MNKNIVIVHYNTPYLTECLVRSINLFVKDAVIYVFDNSDKYPFDVEFDNVTIIDNTKGQIIDFDKWLENYPNKTKSNGRVNKWGSAKHCYSVDKCMEIIGDNFFLLDSDILLTRDISEIADDSCVYVGETIYQPDSKIMRVLPFLCYINVKLCKELGIHYFDENYMHGLSYTKNNKHADWYDTGAGFYLHSSKFKCKEIKIDNYIVHYGHGSWKSNKSKVKKLTDSEWITVNRKLWDENYDNCVMNENYKEELKKYCSKKHPNINIDNPKTIQDKINWLKVNRVTELKTNCADKIKVHEYCKEKIGKDICVPIIKTYNNTNEINWDELPDKFVIKCNHGSGMNIIINKNDFDKNDTIKNLDKWMKTDFAFQNGYEMQYHNIERKIFVEEFLDDSKQQKSLYDYKFWCFNGIPQFYTINDGHGHGKWMNFYDLDGNLLPCKRIDFLGSPTTKIDTPNSLKTMIECSKKLSEPFEFVRVDFYEVNGEIYLGELTFTPGSGFFEYKDNSYSLRFGNMLDIHRQRNKKVVYTCITGGYDVLKEPKYITEGFDYVCFTDNVSITSNTWDIRPLPEESEGLSQIKKQRYVKINAHKVLPEYEISIWVDGNVDTIGNLNEFVDEVMNDKVSVYVPQHPRRNCIYSESNAVISMKKDKPEMVNPQIERYKEEGFPKDYGLLQSNIMLRKHNSEDCIRLMEAWFNELKDNSHRDQLSFNYVLWKNDDIDVVYLNKLIYKSKWFKWYAGHSRARHQQIKTSTRRESVTSGRKSLQEKREEFIKLIRGRRLKTHNVEIY